MIRHVTQRSSKVDRPWFTDVTVDVDGLHVLIGGTAYVAGQAHSLQADILVEPPVEGVESHMLMICTDGTLILDPGPQPSHPLYGQLVWFEVPAGCADLAAVDINQLVHVEEVHD